MMHLVKTVIRILQTDITMFIFVRRFEALKKLIRQEHVRELQRKYETEQKQELKDLTSGHGLVTFNFLVFFAAPKES